MQTRFLATEAVVLFSMTAGMSFAAMSFLVFLDTLLFPSAFPVPAGVIQVLAVGLGIYAAGIAVRYRR